MATIHDVAKKAQVSIAAVSLVLNNKSGVSSNTITKVKKVAKQLGYKAQNLRAKKTTTGTIGFAKVIRHGHILNQNHQAFIADYIDGLSLESSRHGYKTEIITFEKQSPLVIMETLQKNNLDGAIILATEMTPAEVSKFSTSPVPVVFMDACYDALPFDFADMNNIGAVSQIISYFVTCGHTDIGLVQASFETPNFLARHRAFEQTIKDHGLKIKNCYKVNAIFEVAYKELCDTFSKAQTTLPTAIFCVHDMIALATIRALRDCEYKVPEDISVIGFDNLSLTELSEPPLTSYKVSKKAIGKKAAELLSERITNPQKPVEKIRIDGALVKRGSVLNKNQV